MLKMHAEQVVEAVSMAVTTGGVGVLTQEQVVQRNLPFVRKELSGLQAALSEIRAVMGASGYAPDFQQFLGSFLEDTAAGMAGVEAGMVEADTQFTALARFINGPGNKLDATAFFTLMAEFASNLEKARQANIAAADELCKSAARKAASAARKATQRSSGASCCTGMGTSIAHPV
ncbi:hypothetical protein FOA52_004192 [Chlamydomonas sp. UWO 241]|nr:hypothetical protein FOA52_004192 [Chlamydomonas sp. UWO 241]